MFNFIKTFFYGSRTGAFAKDPCENYPNESRDHVPSGPWVGVDLDGTLARWDENLSRNRVGEPVLIMLSFVKRMVNDGIRVKIFTARASDPSQVTTIRKWLKKNGLPSSMEITNIKDYGMERLYDDRSIQVERNTGRIITDRR